MMSRAVMVISVEMSRRGAFGQAVFILQPDPDGADRPAAEEFRQHDGGVIADDLTLTIEEQEGAGLLQRGDGLFGHLRAILGGRPRWPTWRAGGGR